MKKTLIILAGVLFAGGAVFFYLRAPSGGGEGAASGTTANGTSALTVTGNGNASSGADVLATLTALNNVSFDTSFFSREDFRSLEDFSVTLVPGEVGRENPFAPVSPTTQGGSASPSQGGR